MQRVEKSIRVAAPVERVYDLWRNFEYFPQFMEHVESVHTVPGNRMSHWKLGGPMGSTVEFDAEMTEDDANRSIGWRSTDGNIGSSGNVTFAPLGDGETEVHVVMQWYDPPGGPVGEAASRLLQDPDKMLEEDLQRFKDIVEGRIGSGLRR